MIVSNQNKKLLIKSIRNLFFVLVFGFLAYFLWENKVTFVEIFSKFSVVSICVGVALVLAQNVFQFLLTQVLVKPFGISLTLLEALKIGFSSSLVSSLFPMQAGVAVKAYYLSIRNNLTPENFLALMVAQKTFRLLTCSVIAIVGIYFASFEVSKIATIACMLILTFSISLFFLPYLAMHFYAEKMTAFSISGKTLASVFSGMKTILGDARTGLSTLVLNVLVLALNAMLFLYLFSLVGQTASQSSMLVYTAAKFVLNIVAILPANLGISETITGLYAQFLGTSMALGVVIAVYARILSVVVFSVGGLLVYFLHREGTGACIFRRRSKTTETTAPGPWQ